ncbi:MAG: GNAT family N-acetyltransferase [Ferruginibacter sp.]
MITARLYISLLSDDDHAFITELVNTKGWIEFIGDRNIHTTEAALAYINKINSNPNITYWVVRLGNNNVPIGVVSFIKRDYLDSPDIGFAFLPQYAGHGYAFEAASAVLSSVTKENPRILATTIPHNVNSIKLLKKLGFSFEKEIEAENEKLHVYAHTV